MLIPAAILLFLFLTATVFALILLRGNSVPAHGSDEIILPPPEEFDVEEPVEEVPEPPVAPQFFSPLTATAVPEDESRRRPLAVMTDNARRAMPHVGISAADFIYEFLVEDSITRLMGLFTDFSRAAEYGPIRSAREYFIPFAMAHDAVFVHAGGDTTAYDVLRSSGVNNINEIQMSTGDMFFRSASRRASGYPFEHTLMMNAEKSHDVAERYRYRAEYKDDFSPPFAFTDEPLEGESANFLRFVFSQRFAAEFKFDETTGTYARSQYGEPHIDDGEQLSFANILALFAVYTPTGHVNGYLRCDINRGGSGFFLTGGRVVPVAWKFDPGVRRLVVTGDDGGEIALRPGKTIVCIAPKLDRFPVLIE